METYKESPQRKDLNVIANLLMALTLAFSFLYNGDSAIIGMIKMGILFSLPFCIAVGLIGKKREIGYGKAVIISLFVSPIIGLIFALLSPNVKDEEYKQKMLELAANKNQASNLDELLKLNELRKDGAITQEEFDIEKTKILNR